jgi:hypothetical protein
MKENWNELVAQQERSGMKPTEFCRARGIDPSKFGYQRWRRRGAQKKERFVRVDKDGFESSSTTGEPLSSGSASNRSISSPT